MLKLSLLTKENQFAIPREEYILKTNPSSRWIVQIMYLGNGEF